MTEKSIASMLNQAWRKFCNNDALKIDNNLYSYDQLFSTASNIANQFEKLKITNKSVLVLSKKTFIGYVNILSSFMSQNTYIPLNHSFPVTKNCDIIKQSLENKIIVDPSCVAELITIMENIEDKLHVILVDISPNDFQTELWPKHHFDFFSTEKKTSPSLELIADPQKTAYLLFTSGSTGRPKGVPISESNLLHYLSNIHTVFEFCETDRHSQFFDFTFDLSIHDLFVCWSSGGCLVAANEFAKLMPLHFAQRNQLTVWFSVPSLIASAQTILKEKFNQLELPDLRHSLFCGEALPSRLAKSWSNISPNSTIDNLYGPTEATIAFTHYRCEKLDTFELDTIESPVVPIGKPFGLNKTMILDQSLNPIAPGEDGDLYLAGNQLSKGYWQDKLNTTSSFKTIVFNNEEIVIYQSGDRVSEAASGNILYHGRIDQQVQLRGYRVELQEIEYVIQGSIPKHQVVVIPYPLSEEGEALGLMAFHTSLSVHKDQLQRVVADKLPDYMRPSEFCFLEKIPVNDNGKVDRKKLFELAQAENLEENYA